MILLRSLLEILLPPSPLLEEEAEAEGEVGEGDADGGDTLEHALHAHAPDAANFWCTIFFLHAEHDLFSGILTVISPQNGTARLILITIRSLVRNSNS